MRTSLPDGTFNFITSIFFIYKFIYTFNMLKKLIHFFFYNLNGASFGPPPSILKELTPTDQGTPLQVVLVKPSIVEGGVTFMELV